MKYLFEKDIFITKNLILGKNSCFLKVIQFFEEKVIFEIKLKVFMKNKNFLEIIFFVKWAPYEYKTSSFRVNIKK